jgi:hypothetical protein
MLRYEDFELVLTQEGDRHMAEVRRSPAGPSEKVAIHWPFDDDQHEVLLLRLENAVLKGRGSRSGLVSLVTPEEKVLREFGGDVFQALFEGSHSVAKKFASSIDKVRSTNDLGLRVVLRVDAPKLANLPWEYMFEASFDTSKADAENKHKYLCLRRLSPIVRFLNAAGALTTLHVQGPLRILGMICNPATEEWRKLDAEDERHRIQNALQDQINAGTVHLEWVRGSSYDDLFEMMQSGPWHVFHFIGHGGTERYTDEHGNAQTTGFVVMKDSMSGAAKVSADHLGWLLETDGQLRLAVLNCCDSAQGSSGVSSVGAALVHSGVPHVVAMQYAITDGSAARFGGAFYKALVGRKCIEEAVTHARRFMAYTSNIEWGIPVVFTRTGPGVLFDVKVVATPTVTKPAVPATSVPSEHRAQAREELRQLFSQNRG